jgi:hypothetical protein
VQADTAELAAEPSIAEVTAAAEAQAPAQLPGQGGPAGPAV